MVIVESKIAALHPQRDGRTFVAEEHLDVYRQTHCFEYLAERGTDWQRVLQDRAKALPSQLAEAEMAAAFASLEQCDPDKLRYASREQFLAFVRERFRTAKGQEAAQTAAWLERYTTPQEQANLFADAGVPNVKAALQTQRMKLEQLQEVVGF